MTGDRFNGIVQFLKESFYRNKLCKNKDKQPVLYRPGVAHMLASRVPYKDPVRICSKWSLVEKPKDVLSSPSSICRPCLGPRSWVGFVQYFLFQSEEKLIDPLNTLHSWRNVRPACRPTSWLYLFFWFSSIRD